MTIITARQKAALTRTIEKHRAKVAKVRDDLREAVSEIESLLESCDRAEESLQDAIGALSELA